MGIFSSKSKKVTITERDNTVLQLKKQRDALMQYQKKIMGVIERDRQIAKQLLQQNKKDRAKLLLRKKKYQEDLLNQTSGQLDNIETMINEVEFASVKITVIENLKRGNEALKKLNQLFSIEDVENILSDTQEYKEKVDEISGMIAGVTTPEEEEDVEKELDELLSEELPEVPEHVPEGAEELPEVPSPAETVKDKRPKPTKSAAAKQARSQEAVLAD